jgi:hypothetical protein
MYCSQKDLGLFAALPLRIGTLIKTSTILIGSGWDSGFVRASSARKFVFF